MKRPGRAEDVAVAILFFGLRRCVLCYWGAAIHGRGYDGDVRDVQLVLAFHIVQSAAAKVSLSRMAKDINYIL
jgi:hypothetical protein